MIPDFQDFYYPVLEYFADFERHTTKEANQYLQDLFKVTAEESKTKLYGKRFSWTLNYFVRAQVLERVEPAVYMITERGIDLFNESEGFISYNRLLQYPEFRKKEWDQRSTKKQAKDVPSEERLQELRECDWKDFEQAIHTSVANLGFDYPFNFESVEEEGIKGLAFKEEEAHWIEAVQYDTLAVNGKHLKNFEEEMNGHQASRGVLMTTSRFSREVVDTCPDTIQLIDGNGIVQLLEESKDNPQPEAVSKAISTNNDSNIESLKAQLCKIVATWALEHNQAVSFILECDVQGNTEIELLLDSSKEGPIEAHPVAKDTIETAPIADETEVEPEPTGPLKVEFPDGTTLHELYGNRTLLEAIKIIGPERILPFHLMSSPMEHQGKELIQTIPDPKLKGALKPIKQGFYLQTSSPTDYKAQLLVWISQKLNLGLKVWCEGELVTKCQAVRQLETPASSDSKPIEAPEKKPSQSTTVVTAEPHQETSVPTIRVTFPNGKTICNTDSIDTLIEIIKKAGTEKVYHKNYSVETKARKKLPLIGIFRDRLYFGEQKMLTIGRYLTANLDIYTQIYIINKISKEFKLWTKVELVDNIPMPKVAAPPKVETTKTLQEISDENSYLAITLPHGQMLTGDAFVEFFKYADAAKIRFTETGRTTNDLLLFKQANPNYDKNIYVSVGCGYCVKCDYSNQEKYRIVTKINAELNLGLKVELRISTNHLKEKQPVDQPLVTAVPSSKHITTPSSSLKPLGEITQGRIEVRLPNGMKLQGEPYLEVIKHLDTAKVRFTQKARALDGLIKYDPAKTDIGLRHYQPVGNGYYARVDYTAQVKYVILRDIISEMKSQLQIRWIK